MKTVALVVLGVVTLLVIDLWNGNVIGITDSACPHTEVAKNHDLSTAMGLWYEMYRDKNFKLEKGECGTDNYYNYNPVQSSFQVTFTEMRYQNEPGQ